MDKKHCLALAVTLALGIGVGAMLSVHGGEDEEHGHDASAKSHASAIEKPAAEHAEHAEQEGLLELSEAQISNAAIELQEVKGRAMSRSISLPGEIGFNEDRTSHVVPRISGVVESVKVTLGQGVQQGELLAVIASQQISEQRSELAAAQRRVELARTTFTREQQLWQDKISAEQDYLLARQALQEAEIALSNARQKTLAISGSERLTGGNRYELRAPFAGVVVEKHLVVGEVVNEASNAFTVSDLSQVWATFSVSPKNLNVVQVGQLAEVRAGELKATINGRVAHVGNLLGEQTRSATARVLLANPQGTWRPGLFVEVLLATETQQVAVVVPEQALQTIEEQTSVFVRVKDGFVVQPVTTGIRQDGYVEIINGLAAGAQVATRGSFILKSELGKGSAEHAH
ncbi:MAG: efflux RND transporter periplasmic adaptor subunit [Pseudomonadaceae bacterium]|nr:efflux RND transporter periplasmic adaptor subunit [Pseudomonadaceae bacterium]